ncbi:MAG: T9SS type A sorting domain-containing protein [Saprospiraceae bacterium]|nr:T9SS type A sorting domain-containing protein [Saprospiraceae bacterium]
MREIRVLNTQGVMVLTVSVSPTEEYVLDIQSLQPGLYIVEALDSQQGIHHARLACVR